MERLKIAILPARGAFGTALSVPLIANGHEITLVFRDDEKARVFGETRQIERIPRVRFPENIKFTADAEKTVKNADLVILAAPTRFLQTTYEEMVMPFKRADTKILSLVKGLIKIEDQYLRPSEVILTIDPKAVRYLIVLSGPNLAREIAQGLPFVSVVASEEPKLAEYIAHDIFGINPKSRIYPSDDVAGVELGGAFKNIIAIAAGVSDGRHYGENARAALIQRGQEEIIRLGVALGGRKETLGGVAGNGDLWLTCTSETSRNHQYGKEISHGRDPKEVLDAFLQAKKTVEGFDTTKVAWELARKYGVRTPITDTVYSVLHGRKSIDDAIKDLLGRDRVYENGKPLSNGPTVSR